RAHEYGGGAYAVAERVVFASNFADNLVYRHASGLDPIALTKQCDMRFADMVVDHQRKRLISVREDHSRGGEAVNELVAFPSEQPGDMTVLASGHDFFSSPVLSPDGSQIAWLTWDHPNMPWDGTDLWMARVAEDGTLRDQTHVAGGPDESIFAPQWSPDGTLYFVSDRSNWWNLYRVTENGSSCILAREAEFGVPQWTFGQSTYAFVDAATIVCTFGERGISHLGVLDVASAQMRQIHTHYTTMAGVTP
ncbi:MAG: S9 family peptidase, partial [Firmicutes bacterium]|nr:S9 family peptidase [Bacillota bacterium]